MNNNSRTKSILVVAACAVIVLLVTGIITLILNLQTQGYPELTLSVSPTKANITINGNGASSGTQKVKPGKITIVASRDGYKSQTHTLTLKKDEKREFGIVLQPESKAAREEQGGFDESAVREGISSEAAIRAGERAKAKNPIITELPYLGPGLDFRVDYGIPIDATRAKEGYLAIQIAAPTPKARQEALQWMRSIGEDPSAYEIVFVDYKGAIKDSGGILND